MLVVGYAVHGAALLVLLGALPLARFTLAVFLLKAASNFTLPFVLARIARLDGGRGMGLVNMAIGGGLAIGPAISGGLIEATGSFTPLIVLTLGWMLASVVLVLRATVPSAPRTPARPDALPA